MTEAQAVLEPYRSLLAAPFDELASDLAAFAALLVKWNAAQNLVSRETIGGLWQRHMADSLQLLPLLRATDRRIIDLGSGGGFPAIPLAIVSKETDRRFVLVEPIGKKASFLRTAARELGLACEIHAMRAGEVDSRETADVVMSRALAPLPTLCGMAVRFFGPNTRALFHKGREHGEEVRQAAALWDFDVLVIESAVDGEGVVLELSRLRSKSAP